MLRPTLRGVMSCLLPLVIGLLAPLLVAAGDPEVTITRVENLPNRLFYFEDTPVSYQHLDLSRLKLTPR